MMAFSKGLLPGRQRAAAVGGLAALFLTVYLAMDLREGGRASSLTTTRLSTPSFYIDHFGAWFFWGALALDAALAVASALLVVMSVAAYRDRRAAGGGLCSVAATAIMGFAVFGCPGCMVPLFGTLGVAFFANTLPLFGLEFKLLSLAIVIGTMAWMGSTRRSASGAEQVGWA